MAKYIIEEKHERADGMLITWFWIRNKTTELAIGRELRTRAEAEYWLGVFERLATDGEDALNEIRKRQTP